MFQNFKRNQRLLEMGAALGESMRVITGSARGARLEAPKGVETRPTSDMAKEAIFSIVQLEVEGARVLDLFCGSGQLGIEALSRGARDVVFVDNTREAIACVNSNLQRTKLEENARLLQSDATSFVKTCSNQFDLVLMDPPYNKTVTEAFLAQIAALVAPGGILICETQRQTDLPAAAGGLTTKKEYRYGKAKITTFRGGEGVL